MILYPIIRCLVIFVYISIYLLVLLAGDELVLISRDPVVHHSIPDAFLVPETLVIVQLYLFKLITHFRSPPARVHPGQCRYQPS